LSEVLDWVFQLEIFFAASTEFQIFPDRLRFAATLFKDGELKWWRNIHDSAEFASWEDLYSLMIKKFQPLESIKKARDGLASLTQTQSVATYSSLFRTINLMIT
jgi:hypothetical protein